MFSLSDGRPAPAAPESTVVGPTYRFTVLTDRLIRMEWHPDGTFVDEATQAVVDRALTTPEFRVTDTGDRLEIRTRELHLVYDKQEFSPAGLSVTLLRNAPDPHYATWRYGQEFPDTLPFRGNLRGTVRTLDEVDGACDLEDGLLSTYGFSVLDDSATALMTADGWIGPRPAGGRDLYFFGHGRDFTGALQDYFRLTGPTPLLPRYALGNWWSRYWKYTDTEYLGLLDRFDAERVPFSVAVIDMDWHLVDIDPELGTGWTGYSWNRELFPDPPAFLDRLHERGLAVTLNVHPADGVRRHEDHYPAMARALGLDPERGEQIPFDVTDRRFVEAYLRELHHPLEDEGVDFWWLDWQSGGVTGVAGLDPLWMLNHVHYQDSGRGGRRPITFSRYSGPGAHRYPVGFSGDTIITWESLDFQPYFTATAANVGFYWWSNDVGGHMFGYRDPELAVRWFQLGVFSPINRLHSSSSAFTGKEPWRYGPEAAGVMSRFLRLRHLLVPYLYSAAWAAHTDGVGVVRPVYHDHPVAGQAYAQRNQFLFGPDLLVAPITAPADDRAQVAVTSAWLPDGEWFDLFTGNRYRGGRTVALHRPLGQYPVLARGGTVLPLAASAAADVRENPGELVLRVFPGAGSTTMVEDAGQGEPRPEDRQLTHVEVTWRGDELVLTIDPPTGPGALTTRRIAVDLAGAQSAGRALLACAGEEHEIDGVPTAGEAAELFGPALRLDLGELDLADGVRLTVHGVRPGAVALGEQAFDLLDRAQIPFVDKERALDAVGRLSGAELAGELATIDLPETLRHALLEVAACAQD